MIEAKNLPAAPDGVRLRRALLSAYDKTGLVAFARKLADLGIELISSGGTARHLREAGLAVVDVASVTGSPEILGGRVKTLHPGIHGAILARRGHRPDDADLASMDIRPIDLVVVNLYPFFDAVASPEVTDAVAAENIDIGGPAMTRAAAKNFAYVAAVTSPADYDAVAAELGASGGSLALATRRRLAARAFALTADYDAAIQAYLTSETADALPDSLRLSMPRQLSLRYGENPHQAAAFYGKTDGLFEKLHGKALSYNNLLDLSAALALIDEFADADPAVAILKHTNPCGVAVAATLQEAYEAAFATDRQSPFGGIVVANRPLTLSAAEAIDRIFTEIIIAPEFESGVRQLLMRKKNRRLIRQRSRNRLLPGLEARLVLGGALCQRRDLALPPGPAYRCVTERAPTAREQQDLDFAWRVAKHVKSNAIVYGADRRTLGIGAGQMSRIDASELAVLKARKSGLSLRGSVVASDAFFPFADGLVAAADAGATAAIQPGGSIRDAEVIRAANERGMAMVFTGKRHFRH